jgi:hypothetical protein
MAIRKEMIRSTLGPGNLQETIYREDNKAEHVVKHIV